MSPNLAPPFTGLGGRYHLLRSYVRGFATNWPAGSTWSTLGNPYILSLPAGFGGNYKLFEFKPEFHTWNSNSYTADWMFESCYVAGPLLPPSAPEAMALRLRFNPVNKSMYFAFDVGFWSDWFYFDLPPAPGDYWTTPL